MSESWDFALQFSDEEFLNQNLEGCLRVCALMGYFEAMQTEGEEYYTNVRYDSDTQTVTEVSKRDLLSDVFYKRKSYGTIYSLEKDSFDEEDKTQQEQECQNINPIQRIFESNVDRTYMANRHGSQFVGGDHFSLFQAQVVNASEEKRKYDRDPIPGTTEFISRYNTGQLPTQSCGEKNALASQLLEPKPCGQFRYLGTPGGSNLVTGFCTCDYPTNEEIVKTRQSMVFDFENFGLKVFKESEFSACSLMCNRLYDEDAYVIDISPLHKQTSGFNHASCQCSYPSFIFEGFAFIQYDYLNHIHCYRRGDQIVVSYNNIVTL